MAKSTNQSPHTAKAAKNDEFYTQLADIEKFEITKTHLLLLQKEQPPIFFSNGTLERDYFYEYDGFDENGKELRKIFEITKFIPAIKSEEFKKANGDFRSEESIALLRKADIVVTNPPFSLFREFVAQLMDYDKNFVTLGNKNAITYKELLKRFSTPTRIFLKKICCLPWKRQFFRQNKAIFC